MHRRDHGQLGELGPDLRSRYEGQRATSREPAGRHALPPAHGRTIDRSTSDHVRPAKPRVSTDQRVPLYQAEFFRLRHGSPLGCRSILADRFRKFVGRPNRLLPSCPATGSVNDVAYCCGPAVRIAPCLQAVGRRHGVPANPSSIERALTGEAPGPAGLHYFKARFVMPTCRQRMSSATLPSAPGRPA
jgi:hypothetical protein